MDELLGKQVPHSVEAEQAVIGSLLIDSRCVPQVLEALSADDFYIKANRDIFETVSTMLGTRIDPLTVIEKMKVNGSYTDNVAGYMKEVMLMTPTAANVMEYTAIVRDRALLRNLGTAADDINNMVRDGAGKATSVLEMAESRVFDLSKEVSTGGLQPMSAIMLNVLDTVSAMAESGNAIPGIPTGLVDLDKTILGLNKSELIIIAARPGMGKTSIALNIAQHVGVTLQKHVAIFSLEMSREQMATRLLSKASSVPSNALMTGQLSDAQWKAVTESAQELSRSNIRINDNPSLTVAEMHAQCRRLGKNLDLVVIDYLQLMTSAGTGKTWSNESRTQAVSDISRSLKIMAKDLQVPVICLSQLSRANEGRTDKRPMLSDLRESGSIEQDADVVIGLYREGYYNKQCENPNLAEAIVMKNRKGAITTVPLAWLPEYTAFGNLARPGT